MKQWIQRWRLMWLFSKMWPLCSNQEPEWTDQDGAELRAYFKTESGKKLIQLMRYREQASNASAVLAQDRRNYTCGWAGGQRGAYTYIYTLSQVGVESDNSGNSTDGAEELAERLTP
ncbi:MAG: hypothetical protein AAF636_11495 [Pseudomonadota bacterium]